MNQKSVYIPLKTEQPLNKDRPFEAEESTLHFHRCFEMDFILGEGVTARMGEETISLKQYDIFFVPDVFAHAIDCADDSGLRLTVRAPRRLCSDFCERFHERTMPVVMSDAEYNEALLPYAKEYLGETSDLIRRGFLDVIFGKLLTRYPLTVRKRDKRLELASRIFGYIEEHCSEDLTLSSLAENFEFSKEYFSRLFNSCADRNLNQFINRARLEKFLSLAEDRRIFNISALALECGFQSPATFYRTFKETFHTSPQEYLETFQSLEY